MPRANQFRHQAYTASPPAAPHCLVTPGPHPPVGSEEFQRRMDRVGAALDSAGVAAIYLAHGTFVGPDALGVLAGLARVFPKAGTAVRRVIKRIVDKITGEVGNYTGQFAQSFESAINRSDRPRIPVRRFAWSSENHHLGRADGAVRLIDELAARRLPPGKRLLLWGHSHAGNVFALVTNLLAGDRQAVDEFFKATEVYYTWPIVGCVDIPVWNARPATAPGGGRPASPRAARHGHVWHADPLRLGLGRLRPALALHQPPPRRGASRIPSAVSAQARRRALGGRRRLHPAVGHRRHERHAEHLLLAELAGRQPTERASATRPRPQKPTDRFQAGAIVPDEGTTLLVDYGPLEGGVAQHLAGHAVYTSSQWLLYHAEETVRRFYE